MEDVRFLVDSCCDLALEEIKKRNLYYIPLNVHFGEDEFKDVLGLSLDDFYQKVEDIHPTTSQPSPQEFMEVYEKARDEGTKKLYAFHLGSLMSGTIQSANIAKNLFETMYDDMEIVIKDSMSVSAPYGLQLFTIMDVVKRGTTEEELDKIFEKLQKDTRLGAVVNSTKYLIRGGRLRGAKAFASKILSLKPIICIIDGGVEGVGSSRSFEGAMKKIIEYQQKFFTAEQPLRANYAHSIRPDLLEEMKRMTEEVFNVQKYELTQLGSVISTHLGPNGVGLALTPLIE
ncbi:MAG: DegV family protein [Candidatus Heimdallarchaeota archaeon]|nr:DegV family protein [Candidatus Heimdallarchaeota archaeon]MCK5050024.1 DegV family protein [Candidatus Heimdallarchaeota archaeon]